MFHSCFPVFSMGCIDCQVDMGKLCINSLWSHISYITHKAYRSYIFMVFEHYNRFCIC